MDGGDRVERRKSLKELLGLNQMGCCGATWGFRSPSINIRDEEENEEGPPRQQTEGVENIDVDQTQPENTSDPGCVGQTPATPGMNLATALAAERHFRAVQDPEGVGESPVRSSSENGPNSDVTAGTVPGTPLRVSLMRLLEESDGVDGEREKEKEEKGGGCDSVCCVCMGRKKGAAFIPCGHTFCRVCSRELWLNRGSCPLCNRLIVEILDIF
ncbi:putative E3 ubiquitin-protein ligase XBAT35 [Cornus florida]|uniref:putative E3 ubiquitin-protein ligase XBAT35 n=1 Tax=Cornus florida TaxID=4283 RepID=UPI0028A129C2|nr:putative E3 ubiquitin-protein ligase XBAT35 [Cornus florida]